MEYFYVVKGKEIRPYFGRCVLYDGLLWSATNEAPPTKFLIIEHAEMAIETSKKKWPNEVFKIISQEPE